jgi:hypothetical protein
MGTTRGITYDGVVASLNYVVENVLIIAGIIAIGAIVYYGFRMTISKGDPTSFGAAREHLIQAGIGTAIIFGVYTIIATVYSAAQSVGQ